jgi:tRNA G18 (ribose-2'-O)-methylase SpoU
VQLATGICIQVLSFLRFNLHARGATGFANGSELGADSMSGFVHERHKPPTVLERPRELIVACAPQRSNINLSRIVRVASCSGVSKVIACGTAKIIGKIARDGADTIEIEVHRTLPPVLKELKRQAYQLTGLEQTTNSQNLHAFPFNRKTVLVVGNERAGLSDDVLCLLDQVVEIPVYGLPYSYNVATAATMALYEYCRQFPRG